MSAPTVTLRFVHTLAMALLLGGAALLSLPRARAWPHAARAYEWVFWSSVGVSVATGVGNVAALGEAPGPDTRWGLLLVAKLGVLLALLVASGLRSWLVATRPGASARLMTTLYGGTTAALAAVVALAVAMSHG